MVHDDVLLSDIDKFTYLLGCLSGPALSVVAAFQVSEENYKKALERLKERYDKKVLILLEHVSSLFAISQMRKSDSSSLREILDTVAALRGSLLSLGTEQNAFEAILIQLVLQKVDSDSKHAYDRGQNYEQFPTWDNFYNILGRHCQFLECSAKPGQEFKQYDKRSEKLNHPHKKAFLTARGSCIKCDSTDHNLGSCPSFVATCLDQTGSAMFKLSSYGPHPS